MLSRTACVLGRATLLAIPAVAAAQVQKSPGTPQQRYDGSSPRPNGTAGAPLPESPPEVTAAEVAAAAGKAREAEDMLASLYGTDGPATAEGLEALARVAERHERTLEAMSLLDLALTRRIAAAAPVLDRQRLAQNVLRIAAGTAGWKGRDPCNRLPSMRSCSPMPSTGSTRARSPG